MNNFIAKIIKNDLLNIIRLGFVNLSAIMVVMSILTLIINFPVESVNNFLKEIIGTTFYNIICYVSNTFYNHIALFVVISISYQACQQYQLHIINGIVVSLLSYLTFCPVSIYKQNEVIEVIWLNSNNIFFAIIIGISIPFLLQRLRLLDSRLELSLAVPNDIVDSFKMLIPDIFILVFVLIMNFIVNSIFKMSILELIQLIITQPLNYLGSHLFSLIIVNFGISLFWFFGFNGSYIFNSVMTPILMTFSIENLTSSNLGNTPTHIITYSFQTFYTHLGGCGSTLALILALIIYDNHYRKIAQISLIPSLFNINEPIIYGVPVILNKILFIPFIICPVINTILAYFSMYFGLVKYTNGIQLPWTTPIFISGFLSSGISGMLLQLCLLIIDILVYIPFIKKMKNN